MQMSFAPQRSFRVAFAAVLLAVVLALPATAADVKRVVSPGGIEAWLVEDDSNPLISVEIGFRGGAVLDPDGKEGTAAMTAVLLDEGAGELDSVTFQEELNDRSISLRFSAGQDRFGGSLQFLTRERDRAFELLHLALSEPRFEEEAVERIRGQMQASARRRAQDPGSIAWDALGRLVQGEHPYGRSASGTESTLAAITPDDMRAFVRDSIARDRLFVGVAGDITAEELGPLLDKAFGELPATGGATVIPETSPRSEGGLAIIERPVPQSVAVMAQPGIKRDDPDYYTAFALNYVLGGGSFASRLMQEVREERGLAYSVYSALSPRDEGGLIVASVATRNDGVAESIDIMREEWSRFAEEGPTAEELADAKTFLTGSFPLRLDSLRGIARMLLGMQMEDLGIDYIDRRNDYIEAITLEDAKRVAKRLFDDSQLSIVVVGQPEGLTATLEAPSGS